jgi:polyhydroxyalkanoate synthesis regulator phasin
MRKILLLSLITLFIGCCPPQYHKQRVSDIIEDISDNLETFQAEDMTMQVDYLKARIGHLREELK